MANEKKATNGTMEQVAEMRNGNFVIRRQPVLDKRGNQYVTNDGRLYFKYKLCGTLRGRRIAVDFSPKDKGGYRVLDIVYDTKNEADLIIGEGTMTDDKTGKRTKYLTYVARNVDEDGTVWECGVKPSRDSDKSLLLMMINNAHGGGATA